jgi:hypothetical protein
MVTELKYHTNGHEQTYGMGENPVVFIAVNVSFMSLVACNDVQFDETALTFRRKELHCSSGWIK